MAAPGIWVIDIDPVTLIIMIVAVVVAGYVLLKLYGVATRKTNLSEKRNLFKSLFDFNRLPTVPTLRVVNRGGLTCLELGKRAKLRENSLKDTMDSKGWDITSSPVPLLEGNQVEMGYITHPAGCTVEMKPVIKQIRADQEGKPVYLEVPEVDAAGKTILDESGNPKMIKKPDYIELNFEGIIGLQSDLDDFNESTEREVSRQWVLPFIVGIILGVIIFSPLFAWGLSMIAGGGL